MMTAKHDLQSNGDGEDYQRSRTRPAPEPAPAAPAPATPAPAAPARIDVSGGADPTKADTPEEVSAVLSELSRLRDAGSISEEEFEAKKQELLGRL